MIGKFKLRPPANLTTLLRDTRARRLFAWGVGILLIILLVSIPTISCLHILHNPAGTGNRVKVFDFSTGYTMKRISDDLERTGIISNGFIFTLYARVKGADGKIKAGTYRFSDAMPPAEILRKLVAGEVYELRFPVPEGYSIYQIAELLDQREIFSKKSFLKACFDRRLLDELGIPGRSVEGYLHPSTYTIRPDMDATGFIREMVSSFRSTYMEKFADPAVKSGLDQAQILTLASMVEKEAVVPEERPLIASVFLNRLRMKMPMQSDPTAVYGVRAFAGKVTRRDILRDSPYNTYRIGGLPPGPIGNPGDDAIHAILFPACTRYLYFVARKDGTHYFSETLDEHNRAVRTFLGPAQPDRER